MTKLHVLLALLSTALPACAGSITLQPQSGAVTIEQTAVTRLKYNDAFALRSGLVAETATSPSAPRAGTLTGSEVSGRGAREAGSDRAHAVGMARHEMMYHHH